MMTTTKTTTTQALKRKSQALKRKSQGLKQGVVSWWGHARRCLPTTYYDDERGSSWWGHARRCLPTTYHDDERGSSWWGHARHCLPTKDNDNDGQVKYDDVNASKVMTKQWTVLVSIELDVKEAVTDMNSGCKE
jgi:hypothetical protein